MGLPWSSHGLWAQLWTLRVNPVTWFPNILSLGFPSYLVALPGPHGPTQM